ncbi:MAG: biotin--[acetyl-CoA-carboxylase] ligase [Bacteroidales bacterium]|nr:biotin--[acetyl-CoA-carboxylase] ligase [Bacteroidales bacterium]
MHFGKNIIRFERLDSTNKKARELQKDKDLPEGSIVICHEQYAGRGYGTNEWESAAGMNITATWILKPFFLKADEQFAITKAVSLAVSETVKYFYKGELPVTIKWPNDIYVKNQKIAGILVENNIMGNDIRDCFAGIGLNINQEVFYSDAPNPVSLKVLTGSNFDTNTCINLLSENLQKYYYQLRESGPDALNDKYKNSLYRLGELSEFVSMGTNLQGTIVGTDSYGRLEVKLKTGEKKVFDFKEISFVI